MIYSRLVVFCFFKGIYRVSQFAFKDLCVLMLFCVIGLQASVKHTVPSKNSEKVVTTTAVVIKNRNAYTALKRYFDFRGVPLIIPNQGKLRIVEYMIDALASKHIKGVVGWDTGAGMFPRNNAFITLMKFFGENTSERSMVYTSILSDSVPMRSTYTKTSISFFSRQGQGRRTN